MLSAVNKLATRVTQVKPKLTEKFTFSLSKLSEMFKYWIKTDI